MVMYFISKNSTMIKMITNAWNTLPVIPSKWFLQVRLLQCFIQRLHTTEKNKLQAESPPVYAKSKAFTGSGHAWNVYK